MRGHRILVWGLSNNRAGTESVIENYSMALPELSFDYLCYDYPDNHQGLLHNGDNRFFVIPVKIKSPLRYKRALSSFMHDHGEEYSSLWFNINDVSNIDLLVEAAKYGIERRITHMHNAGMPDSLITQVFSRLNWGKCLQLTTDRWACSKVAGEFLYGKSEFSIVPNMVDVRRVSFSKEKREKLRSGFGIGDSMVIGSIGRFEPQKNYGFLISVLERLVNQGKDAVLLLVGKGSQQEEIVSLAERAGMVDRVILVGPQDDVQSFYSAFDVAVYPSLYEGLSLAIVEAQFNGLPCVLSETISRETVISDGVEFASIENAQDWVSKISQSKRANASLVKAKAERFDISNIRTEAARLFL